MCEKSLRDKISPWNFYVVWFALGFISFQVVYAQTPSPTTARRLDVAQCVDIALRQNLAVQSVRFGIDLADADVDVATSYLDGRSALQLRHEDSELPSSNVPSQGATTSSLLTGDYSRRLASGTALGLRGATSRIEFSGGNAGPETLYISELRFNARQSLLRNAWGRQDKALVQVAERSRDHAIAEYMQQRDRIALLVHEAYWNAHTASNLFLVNQRAFERAKALLEKNRAYVEDGLMDETGLLAAEASLAQRDVEVLNLKNTAQTQLDLLKTHMNLPHQEWDTTIIVLLDNVHVSLSPQTHDLDHTLADAVKVRPDFVLMRVEKERLRAQLDALQQEKKSDLSVFSEMGVGNFANEVGDSFEAERDVWSIGIAWESTTRVSGREAELRKVRLNMERNLLQMRELEQDIVRDLRQNLRDLQVAHDRMAAANRASELQQRKLAMEEIKYDQGRSTTERLIEYQDDLSFAELAEVQAFAEMHLAQVRFDFSRGMLVDHTAVLQSIIHSARPSTESIP